MATLIALGDASLRSLFSLLPEETLRAVRGLSPQQRRIFELTVQGWRAKDIAKALGTTEASVRVQRNRMRARGIPLGMRLPGLAEEVVDPGLQEIRDDMDRYARTLPGAPADAADPSAAAVLVRLRKRAERDRERSRARRLSSPVRVYAPGSQVSRESLARLARARARAWDFDGFRLADVLRAHAIVEEAGFAGRAEDRELVEMVARSRFARRALRDYLCRQRREALKPLVDQRRVRRVLGMDRALLPDFAEGAWTTRPGQDDLEYVLAVPAHAPGAAGLEGACAEYRRRMDLAFRAAAASTEVDVAVCRAVLHLRQEPMVLLRETERGWVAGPAVRPDEIPWARGRRPAACRGLCAVVKDGVRLEGSGVFRGPVLFAQKPLFPEGDRWRSLEGGGYVIVPREVLEPGDRLALDPSGRAALWLPGRRARVVAPRLSACLAHWMGLLAKQGTFSSASRVDLEIRLREDVIARESFRPGARKA